MGKTEFGYFKWYTDKAETLEAHLSNEEMGEFFFAVMSYVKNGEKRGVSPKLELLYHTYCDDADRAKQVYDKKCATLRENGSKGGKAKAANAKEKAEKGSPQNTFKPPTKKEFFNAVEHFLENEEIECDEYEAQKFYDELSEACWKIGNRAITSREEWESALQWKFPSAPYVTRYTDWMAFSTIFSNWPQEMKDMTECAHYFFADSLFDKEAKIWIIRGQQYTNIHAALKAHIEDYLSDDED